MFGSCRFKCVFGLYIYSWALYVFITESKCILGVFSVRRRMICDPIIHFTRLKCRLHTFQNTKHSNFVFIQFGSMWTDWCKTILSHLTVKIAKFLQIFVEDKSRYFTKYFKWGRNDAKEWRLITNNKFQKEKTVHYKNAMAANLIRQFVAVRNLMISDSDLMALRKKTSQSTPPFEFYWSILFLVSQFLDFTFQIHSRSVCFTLSKTIWGIIAASALFRFKELIMFITHCMEMILIFFF